MRFFCFLLTLPIALSLSAQERLRGQVLDAQGQPLMAANVFPVEAPQQGTLTDAQGQFELPLPSGDSLEIRYPGFQTRRVETTGWPAEPRVIRLRARELTLQEVQIAGRKPIAEQFAAVQIERLDIYMNPLAAADPLRAITGLAASTNTQESANPSLRGSSAERSRVIFDGVPIYQPVRNSQINGLGLFSLFNTELIETQYVFPSNPPLSFGNSSAGLVQIESREAIAGPSTQFSAGMANLGLMRSQPLGEEAFLQAYANAQFSQLFTGLNAESLAFLKGFQSQDAGLKLYLPLGEKWTLKSFSYGIRESYRAEIQRFNHLGDVVAEKQRAFQTLSLRRQGQKDRLSLNLGGDLSRAAFDFGNLTSRQLTHRQYAALNYQRYPMRRFTWQTGLTYDASGRRYRDTTAQHYFALRPQDPTQRLDTQWYRPRLEGYAFARWTPSQTWQLSAGLRSNAPLGDQAPFISAQLGLRYQPQPRHSLLLSAGRYHSYGQPTVLFRGSNLLRSHQVALDYCYQGNRSEWQAAVYAKREAGPQPEGEVLIEQADIVGVEASWAQTFFRRLDLAIAYTGLLHRVRFAAKGLSYPGSRDLPWFVKAQATYRSAWGSLSASYVGRPGTWFTPIVGGRFRSEWGVYEPQWPDAIHTRRMDNYHNLTLGYSYYRPTDWGSFIFFANLANALNHPNPSEPRYREDYGAITGWQPFSRRTFYVGVVWKVSS
jgi:hypothetical protein